jgi:hypothetical protein
LTPGGEVSLSLSGELPELAAVPWRRRVDEPALRRADRLWTLSTVAHEVPFLLTAAALPALNLLMIPVAVVALAFAWVIPELYAARGAGVLREPPPGRDVRGGAEPRALGLLADLVGHDARALLDRTGLALEPGRLGTWLVGPAGALLVRPGGRRVECYCVRVTGDDLPRSDRIAHLVLALRADEAGFATVANLTFSGARWRLRRRLGRCARVGLGAAVVVARSKNGGP